MSAKIPKPPYEPEFAAFLADYPAPTNLTLDFIPAMRQNLDQAMTADIVLAGEPYTHEDISISGPNGPVTLAIFYPNNAAAGVAAPPQAVRPGIYYTHGGGLIVGNRFVGMKDALLWGKATGAVIISVEYRMAPDHPYPAGMEDCWAGLLWVGEHLGDLGINPDKLMVGGQSAGGNLAAVMALLARDRGGPRICCQMLDCPMLDDRMDTNSQHQFVDEGIWSRGSNDMAWGAYLGKNKGKPDVSPYAAPSRATDLSNLPPAFIGAGAAEVFRDEDVAYAQRLWAAGVPVELHVWPGGFHTFDILVPTSPLSKQSIDCRVAWVTRQLTKVHESKL